jgi:osmotically-inducible protein OsmY
MTMRDQEKGEEDPRDESEKDYYAGYYWGNNPYSSTEELAGRKSDEDLKNDVTHNLKKNTNVDLSNVEIRVFDSSVTLTGSVKTYDQKRLIGKEVWETKGVVKVLNDLDVTDSPRTAGPRR